MGSRMRYQKMTGKFHTGLTLVEMIIALALMTIIFATILPEFRAIQKSWENKANEAEALQNGRILSDHLYHYLSKASRITAVSNPADTDGYIEFEDDDGNIFRCDISANNYVEFGPVGNLAELAGPVSQLQFTCYDAYDLDTPITDVNDIRSVKFTATLLNQSTLGQDKTFISSAYLRTNNNNQCDWYNQDIGDVAAAGSANYAEGTWTIEGSGYDIMYNTDEFHYVYKSLDGDGQIIARVVSLENTGFWAKAGLMIRETLNGNSRYAGMLVTPYNGVYFQYRTFEGGFTNFNWLGYTIHAPCWFKLTRSGSTFNGYVSLDGSAWIPVGGSTWISMADSVCIGMAVGSNHDGVLCTAEIDNISFSTITYEEFNDAKVSSNDTSITISTPGTSEGDLLIAAVATDGDTSVSLAPPWGEGWSEIYIADYSNEVTLGAWWKLADAYESPSHEFTWSGSQQAYGWMMRFTGHDSDNPINDFSACGESSSTPTSPTVTTTVNNCLILRLGAFDGDDITQGYPGLYGHNAITMDKSASSTGLVTYHEFTEAKRSYSDTSITISTPSGTSEADLLIAAVVTDGDTEHSLSPPDGEDWTEIDIDDYDDKVTLGVWWKLADSSESPTHQFTWSNGQEAYGWIMRFTGHHLTNPIHKVETHSERDDRPTSPAVVTTVANCLILRIGGFDDNDIYEDDTGLDHGHVDITMDKSSSHHDHGPCSGGAGYKQQPDIGYSGTVTFNLTGNEQSRAVTIAIAPSDGDGTVSGGAGYIRQVISGDSGTSAFLLGSSNQAQTLTVAIAPDPESTGGDCAILP